MKKLLLSLLVVSALVLSIVPGVFAATTLGSGVGISIITENFPPQVWGCSDRVVYDDATEPGRISEDGTELVERVNNYAFEGEQIQWEVLVMDKNGIEKVGDVYATVGGDIQANCALDREVQTGTIDPDCNARIDEEVLKEFNPDTMAYYTCTLTVETPELMHGSFDVTVEVTDLDEEVVTMAEMEHWFFNPEIALSLNDGEDVVIAFEDNVRPGTLSYSDRVTVGNDAETGSGVLLDMFISGTDFYDSGNTGAKCPDTNQLSLSAFNYYATSGAYSTLSDARKDAFGYVPIEYGVGFNDPHSFYGNNEIIQSNLNAEGYYAGNILSTGAEITLVFRLDLPEPCNGDFNMGQIYFWGEAI